MTDETTVREGGCACGEVRFRITAPILGMAVCDRRDRQYASGGRPNPARRSPGA